MHHHFNKGSDWKFPRTVRLLSLALGILKGEKKKLKNPATVQHPTLGGAEGKRQIKEARWSCPLPSGSPGCSLCPPGASSRGCPPRSRSPSRHPGWRRGRSRWCWAWPRGWSCASRFHRRTAERGERVRRGTGRARHLPTPRRERLINVILLTVLWRLRIKVCFSSLPSKYPAGALLLTSRHRSATRRFGFKINPERNSFRAALNAPKVFSTVRF